jgi:large subunit ribosomal protein L21
VYAVVRTGGKQYRVQEGRPVTIERLPGATGETVELRDVLLLADGENVTVGNPVIEGARVVGTIAEQGRAKKIIVFRFKAKTRARKKNGHRQAFTRFMVEDILAPGQEPKVKAAAEPQPEAATAIEEAPKPRRRAKAAPAATASAADVPATEAASVEAAEPAEKPKRGTRKKAE